MVVLTSGGGNGARYQLASNVKQTPTASPAKTMDSPALKTKSPLLDKSGAPVKLVPFAPKRSSNANSLSNGNQTTTTDGDSLPVLTNGLAKKSPSEVTQNEVNSPADIVVPPKRRKGRPPKSAVTLKASAKAKTAAAKTHAPRQSKVLLDNVIPFITCNLCKGYLVDATTIVECLHTFCHSCIMIHLRQKQYCPCCELMINKTKPNIKTDAIRQAIVYKLVPGLYEKEILRRQEFYRAHPEDAKLASPEQRGEDTENLIFSPNENISLSIEYADIEETEDLDGIWNTPKYLLCPASFTVNQLSKFVVMKIGMDANKFLVDISYKVKTIVLADYYTLMDVAYIYTWKREAPMRFFFSVRTKSTANQELPEVPFRRSPGISPANNNSLPPLLVSSSPATALEICAQVNTSKDNATSDKQNSAGAVLSPPAAGETKLKLVKRVDESQRVSDKKRVVYMVQSPSDNGPQISAAAAYNLLPHESTAVGVHSTLLASPQLQQQAGQLSSSKSTKQQQQQNVQQTPRTSDEATPRYRSLVEKENAKMKKLMQSLSEEKKLLKLRKREAMKEPAGAAAVSPNASLKMKITKSDTGLMVVQNSVEEPKDVLSVIDSVANCDVNDENKKSLFLKAFQLAPKKSIPEQEKMPSKTSTTDSNANEMKKSISFGFSSYEFPGKSDDDKDTEIPPLRSSTPKAESVKQNTNQSPSNGSPGEKTKNKSTVQLKRSASDEKLSASRKKVSSYVKIAPKEMGPPKLQPKLAPKTGLAEKPAATKPILPTVSKQNKTNNPQMGMTMMAPPPVPPQQQQQQQRAPANGSIYAFLQPNPSPKTLFKPMSGPGGLQNISGYSHPQFQTMPSPVYMTNANAGSTPIYSPNSPQYAPNFSLPQNQQFKYTKFPTYMNFSMPNMPMSSAPSVTPMSAPPQNQTAQSSPKLPGLVAAKKDQKVYTPTSGTEKGVSYLNKLPPPPIFSASSGMSITTTTVGPSPPPLAVLPKRSPPAAETVNSGKRKNTSSPNVPAKPQSPAHASREDPPEKQRKVQSLLDSCNITFPSSLSITIANETEDSDKSGLHNNKLKNPVNNYIEILKIPSGDPANCSSATNAASPSSSSSSASAPVVSSAAEQNNKFPLSAASVMQQQQKANNNPGTFTTSSSGVMKPPTPPISTAAPSLKMGSSGSMSITPAITSNMMHLIKGGSGPKDSDLKRKSPPIEVTAVKRPSPSPPQPHFNIAPQRPLQPVTSTAAAGVDNKKGKTVPKLMPKLNPIEKVVVNNKTPTPSVVSTAQPSAATVAQSNNLGVAAAAAAAIKSAKETFQREFLKFAKDKPEVKAAEKAAAKLGSVEVPKTMDAAPKVQRKSPVKIKPKATLQQQKIQPAPNGTNKPQLPDLRMSAPPAIAPFPLASQQQQQQQQRQQQEYTAALLKMMLANQHQQKLAAMQQSQLPTVLGDIMMPNPMAMFANTPPGPSPQQQQQQQLSSLIQQAFYQEHLERMKAAGKVALEQYAQNIQKEANTKLASAKSPKLGPASGGGKAKQGGNNKGPSPVPSSKSQSIIKEEGKKSPPKVILDNKNSSAAAAEDLKKSPKPLQMNNNANQSPVKQEDKRT